MGRMLSEVFLFQYRICAIVTHIFMSAIFFSNSVVNTYKSYSIKKTVYSYNRCTVVLYKVIKTAVNR